MYICKKLIFLDIAEILYVHSDQHYLFDTFENVMIIALFQFWIFRKLLQSFQDFSTFLPLLGFLELAKQMFYLITLGKEVISNNLTVVSLTYNFLIEVFRQFREDIDGIHELIRIHISIWLIIII